MTARAQAWPGTHSNPRHRIWSPAGYADEPLSVRRCIGVTGWQPEASTLVTTITSTNGLPIQANLSPCPAACLQILASSDGQRPDPGCLNGLAILAPAATWLTARNGGPVPYLSSADPSAWACPVPAWTRRAPPHTDPQDRAASTAAPTTGSSRTRTSVDTR